MKLFFSRLFSTTSRSLPDGYREITLGNGKTTHAFSGPLKNTFKRAKNLMNILDQEIVGYQQKTVPRFRNGENLVSFRPGDALEVLYRETGADTRYQILSGVCIGTRRMSSINASFRMLCALGDQKIEFHFPVYSPLLVDIRLVQKAFIHKGLRRVRRAKLYYLRDRAIGEVRTPASQITLSEREEKVIEARRVSYEARMGKKERAQKMEMEAKKEAKKAEKAAKIEAKQSNENAASNKGDT